MMSVMEGYRKYTPDRRRGPLLKLSLALHLALPCAAFLLFGLDEDRRLIWGLAAGITGYFGYLVFALVLHLEYFPEKPAIAARLTLGPPVWAALSLPAFGWSFSSWLAAAGGLFFMGVEMAVALLFLAGTHLVPEDPAAAPGEAKAQWRRDGRSLLRDPDFSPMAAWTMVLFFVMPGFAALVWWVAALGRPAFSGGWEKTYFIIWLIAAAFCVARRYLQVLLGLAAHGRIFGPGRKAFH